MKKSLAKKGKKGFTLIELVVVIAILGILAAILIPIIGGFIQRANEAADQANARNLFNSVSILVATDVTGSGTGGTYTAADLDDFIDLSGVTSWSYALDTTTGGVAWAQVNTATYTSSGSFS